MMGFPSLPALLPFFLWTIVILNSISLAVTF